MSRSVPRSPHLACVRGVPTRWDPSSLSRAGPLSPTSRNMRRKLPAAPGSVFSPPRLAPMSWIVGVALLSRVFVAVGEGSSLRLALRAHARARLTARRAPPGGWTKAFGRLDFARTAQDRKDQEIATAAAAANYPGRVFNPDESETAQAVVASMPGLASEGLVSHEQVAAVSAEVSRDLSDLSLELGGDPTGAPAPNAAAGFSRASSKLLSKKATAAAVLPSSSAKVGAATGSSRTDLGRRINEARSSAAAARAATKLFIAEAAPSHGPPRNGSSPESNPSRELVATHKNGSTMSPAAQSQGQAKASGLGAPLDATDTGSADEPERLGTAEMDALSDGPMVSADWATEQLSANRELTGKVAELEKKNAKLAGAKHRMEVAIRRENGTAENLQTLQEDLSTRTIARMETKLSTNLRSLSDLRTSLALKDHKANELETNASSLTKQIAKMDDQVQEGEQALGDPDFGLNATQGNLTEARRRENRTELAILRLRKQLRAYSVAVLTGAGRDRLTNDLAEEQARDSILAKSEEAKAADEVRAKKETTSKEQQMSLAALKLGRSISEAVQGRMLREAEVGALDRNASSLVRRLRGAEKVLDLEGKQLEQFRRKAGWLRSRESELDKLRATAEGLNAGLQDAKAASLSSEHHRLALEAQQQKRSLATRWATTEALRLRSKAWQTRLTDADRGERGLEEELQRVRKATLAGDWVDIRNPKLRKHLVSASAAVAQLGTKNARLRWRKIPTLRKKLRRLRRASAQQNHDVQDERAELPKLVGRTQREPSSAEEQ